MYVCGSSLLVLEQLGAFQSAQLAPGKQPTVLIREATEQPFTPSPPLQVVWLTVR